MTRHDFDRRAGVIEGLVRTLESAGDPSVRSTARQLVQALMDLHGAGLQRVMELTDRAGATGASLIERFADDPIVKHLLILHGLHPRTLESRVREAVETVGPSLQAKGAVVDRFDVDDDGGAAVWLRVEARTQGHASPPATFETIVSDAIYEAAPDATSLTVHVPEPIAFVPIGNVLRRSDEAAAPLTAGQPLGVRP
jgi:hypothetical protein